MCEFDRKLVELLPSYPAIWKRNSADFKNKTIKDNSMRTLAKVLNTTVEHVQERYKSVREKYRKEKIKEYQRIQSGACPADACETWELMSGLQFLDKVILTRKSTSYTPKLPTEYNNDSPMIQPKVFKAFEFISDLQPTETFPQHFKEENEFDDTVIDTQSSLTLLSPSTSNPSHTSGHAETQKRKIAETDLTNVFDKIYDVVESLRPIAPRVTPSRFDWVAKYIAERLNRLDEEVADEMVEDIIQLLANKRRAALNLPQ